MKKRLLGSQTEIRCEGDLRLFLDFQADLFASQPEFGEKSGPNQDGT